MQPILSSLILCGLQVSVVALIGLAASWVLMRMRPTLAPTILCSTVVAVGVLTLVAPLPRPAWLNLTAALPFERSGTEALAPEEIHNHEAATVSIDRDGRLKTPSVLIDVRWLAARFEELASRGGQHKVRESFIPYLLAGVILLNVVGAVRLLVAFRFVRNVCRNSRPIQDAEVDRMVALLVDQVCPRQSVRIRQTEQLSSAAVSGCRQPTILLPNDWQQWSAFELRSVLAHELAHIARRDFLWRTLSCIITTTHYYNPLVHFLVRQTVLTQELAADALAGQLVGRRRYLRTLSTLALRRDDSDVCVSRVGLHPVFSGYLIRRIRTLKTQQNRRYTKERLTARLSGASLVIIVGALTFAAGGVAQTLGREQASEEKGEVRVARSVPRAVNDANDPMEGMFRRELTDPDIIPENKMGMVKVRIADVFQRPEAIPLKMMTNRLSAHALQRLLKSPASPRFDVSSIDTVFGTTQLTTRHHPEVDRPQKNSLQLGVSDIFVRFSQPANVAKWLEDFAPSVETTQREGRPLYTLPPIPAIGPAPISFAVADERTLGFSTSMVDLKLPITDNSEQLASLVKLAQHRVQTNKSAWASAFRRVDGGLVAYAVTNQEIRTPEEFNSPYAEGSKERIAAEAFHRIEHTFETFAVGLDVDEAGKQLGIRVRVGCSQRKDTEQVASDIRVLLRMGLQRLEDAAREPVDEKGDESSDAGQQLSQEFLERMTIDLVVNSDGSSDVYIRSYLSDPSIVGAIGQFMTSGLEESFPSSQQNEAVE